MIEREAKVIAGTIAAGEVASVAIAWMFSAPWYGALIAASGAAVFFTGVGIVLAFADAMGRDDRGTDRFIEEIWRSKSDKLKDGSRG